MIKNSLYIQSCSLIFITGASILGLELVASRYMSPLFGSSIHIWGAILSITLICLSLGYTIGGRMADKLDDPIKRLVYFVLVSACWIGLIPFINMPVASLALKTNTIVGPIIVVSLLFALPLFLLATATPLVFGYVNKQRQGQNAARSLGDLFAISTIGSVIGALLTAYILIPYLGLKATFLTIALTLILSTIPFIIKGIATKTFVVILVLLALIELSGFRLQTDQQNSQFKVLHQTSSQYDEIAVLEDQTNNSRILLLGGASQNWVAGKAFDKNLFAYGNILLQHLHKYDIQNRRALVLGLGAGTVVKNLHQLGYEVDVVEIDPAVLKIAKTYFKFDDSKHKVFIQDARTFVSDSKTRGESYGIIVHDITGGGSQPGYLYTREFFNDLKSLLDQSGVLVSNHVVFLNEEQRGYADHVSATFASVFPYVTGFDCNPGKPKSRLASYLLFSSFRPSNNPNFRTYYRETIFPFKNDSEYLSNDWNPVELWSGQVNKAWHQSIMQWVGLSNVIPI